ncbi:sigma factor [soil metagenome]
MITANHVKTFDYQHWLTVARRHSRAASEAPDLLQDALLDAIRAGQTDFTKASTRRWFAGVLRNRAAMAARGAARRKRRELAVADIDRARRSESPALLPSRSFVDTLPPSARAVAALVIAGLNRDEIIAALKIAPTAFRQRLTTIRRAWMKLPAPQRADSSDVSAEAELNDLGLMRQALLANVRRLGGIGTHDPDGHLIVLADSRSQSAAPRQHKGKENRHG